MPFKKGQSGNPGGRTKENEEIKKLAQEHGPMAIERLAYWAKSDDARASVAASQALIDRGYGKAPQSIEHSGNLALSHEEALTALSPEGGDDAA